MDFNRKAIAKDIINYKYKASIENEMITTWEEIKNKTGYFSFGIRS